MAIQVPSHFEHAGQLPGGVVRFDPREDVPDDKVVIDLRYCDFVRPPGALWCLIYALLARKAGAECVLLVPENIGVARYLQTIGLFDLLKNAAVHVDDRGVTRADPRQIGIPLQGFETEQDVEDMANAALERVGEQDLGAPNLRPVVAETFAELGINAVQHAESPVSSYGMIQYYQWESGARFVCVVADGGIGIRRSLERNPDLRDRIYYDWDAIELAMLEADVRRTTLFPGTLAYATIPA